jgi:SPP1 gp7 family putative phage head morphogenesis protein
LAADGKNFSDRIWQSKTSMVNELHNELVRNCILGKAPDETIKNMTKFVDKKFKKAKMQAGRLVMTEQAFFASAAQKDCFNELDVEEFEVVATLDSHTSEICQSLDGQHFPMKDYQPGVTAPPFHVYCRSTTVPYFDDEWSVGERAARGEDGKTYYVPSDMKYKDWKKSFVDGGSKEELQVVATSDTIKMKEEMKVHESTDRPIIEQEDIIEQAKYFGDDLLKHPDLIKYNNGEPIGNYLNQKIGYDGLPRVVSSTEFEQMGKEKEILYRGVKNYKELSAQEMVEQFKKGSFYSGRGVYGNGTYVNADKKVAMYYAGDTTNGQIMEMILDDGAKIVSYFDILSEWGETEIYKIPLNKREAYQQVIDNVGAYAAIKGYDAIALDGWQRKNHIVILNRSKVIIKG